MIELEEVSKVYPSRNGEVCALRPTTCRFERGEFVSVVGPSGAGKSTLMLVAGALLRPTQGRVLIDGQDVYGLSATRRARLRLENIGFLFQTFNLLEYLTAEENVQVALSLAGRSSSAQRTLARELLTKMGLRHRLRHLPVQLSVGERQRVALARALANEPPFILADEPTGNLDPQQSEQIVEHFQSLVEEGMGVVMVTHNHAAAARTARSLRLVEGMLVSSPGALAKMALSAQVAEREAAPLRGAAPAC